MKANKISWPIGLVFMVALAYVAIYSNSELIQKTSARYGGRYKRSSEGAGEASGSSKNGVPVDSAHDNLTNEDLHDFHHDEEKRFEVVVVNWARVSNPFIISASIVMAGAAKLVFQLIHKVISRVPESCLLICLGLVIGGIAYSIDKDNGIGNLLFHPDTFFLFILPPIVMEAGYFMPKAPFFDNLGTILTYAIIGTVFNALAIGSSLYGVYKLDLMPGMEEFGGLTILQCLLFGSIISAVDPVAVISVFEEIHVNTVLYICVFGESLLNDGVAVVLFKMFEGYIEIGEDHILVVDVVLAVVSFFVVAFGGLFIGIFYGYIGAFATRFTVHNRIIEPTFVFLLCYLAYLTAEIFHLSGIIAIVFAAFTMSSYVEQNISSKSHTTVKYGLKMLANIAETIIFMLLGIAAVSDFWQYWNTGFVLWTLLFITVYRAVGVYSLTFVINKVRLDKINRVDQFVMAYGGLRGAIAFSLVSLTSTEHVPHIKTMICACIVAILFTSFIQGSTIRPIVECLHVARQDEHNKTMFEDVNMRLIDHVMAGVEDIIGHHGRHHWMQKFHQFHSEYVVSFFVRDAYKSHDQELLETFHRINKRDAENFVEELERGSSFAEMGSGSTFATLFMPYEMRLRSQSSFQILRQQHTEETCIDMQAIAATSNSARVVQDADFHHMLQQNMYQPRKRETLKYTRGDIDEDSAKKRQEEEILLRRRIHLRSKKHHKHRHHKHTHKPRGMASKPSHHSMLSPKSYPQLNPDIVMEDNEDTGITFTAITETPNIEEEETEPAVAIDNKLASPWKRTDDEDTAPTSVDRYMGRHYDDDDDDDVSDRGAWKLGGGDDDDDVTCAIDRELPWKRAGGDSEVAVSDPHVAPSSSQLCSNGAISAAGRDSNSSLPPAESMLTITEGGEEVPPPSPNDGIATSIV